MTPCELKAARIDAGRTITDQAEALHIPRGTYEKYERGDRQIPGDMEWRLALVEKDPSGLALLVLEQTREYGWTEKQEGEVAEEIYSMLALARACRHNNQESD